MPSQTILVLDSGIGGLSICQPIIERFPQLSLHYISDNDAYPYGTKTSDFLKRRVPLVIKTLGKMIERDNIELDAIVIACNTASTVVLPTLRELYSIPVIGVVPAIKTAAEQTRSGGFALLATPGTVKRAYTRDLIDEFASQQEVVLLGSRELVDLVEGYYQHGDLDQQKLKTILTPLLNHPAAKDIDSVVLGCTHFPLIRDSLEKLAPQWQWIDSGPAIASRLQYLLELKESDQTEGKRSKKYFWATSTNSERAYETKEFFNSQLASMGFQSGVRLLTGLPDPALALEANR